MTHRPHTPPDMAQLDDDARPCLIVPLVAFGGCVILASLALGVVYGIWRNW